jgi:hypothetical protein
VRKWEYFRLFACHSGLYISCTDPETAKLVVSALRKTWPKCNAPGHEAGVCDFRIDGFGKKDWNAGIVVRDLLLENGWEPFAVSAAYQTAESFSFATQWFDYEILHFRLERSGET